METITAIKQRRSVRAYSDMPVEKDKVARVLEAARLAPSARNLQDWRFVVVQRQDIRDKIALASKGQEFIKDAPIVIAACGTNPDYIMSCGQYAYTIDISIALTHMMIRATDLELGTCWIGAFNERRVKEALSIPDEVRVVALLTLGYPRFLPQPKSRKPLDDIVNYDRWK
jgi:nitroreductase